MALGFIEIVLPERDAAEVREVLNGHTVLEHQQVRTPDGEVPSPPLVACEPLLGGGHPAQAVGAWSLFLENLICVNLAGMITFLMQGAQPLNWWEKDRAGKVSRIAVGLWGGRWRCWSA